jgi:hypothetical protein
LAARSYWNSWKLRWNELKKAKDDYKIELKKRQITDAQKIRDFDLEKFNWEVYVKPSDWSWLEKTRKKSEKNDRPTLHKYEKIDKIDRRWWRDITEVEIANKDTLIENHWYKSVQLW